MALSLKLSPSRVVSILPLPRAVRERERAGGTANSSASTELKARTRYTPPPHRCLPQPCRSPTRPRATLATRLSGDDEARRRHRLIQPREGEAPGAARPALPQGQR